MRFWPLIAALIAVAHPVAAQSPAWDRLSVDLRALSERCDGTPVETLQGEVVFRDGRVLDRDGAWAQALDIDGDGADDVLLRPRLLRCRGSQSLLTGLGLCGANSCRHRLYLTARAAETVEYFAVDAVSSEAQDGAPRMVVWRQSELCEEAHDRSTCALIGRFEDEEIRFEPAPAPIPLPSLSPAALDQP
ncbi:MAG: hypothetical protein AAFN09_02310 [Pseudomonadota bacterium]